MKLSIKILLLILSESVISILIISYLSYDYTRELLQKQVKATQSTFTINTLDKIDRILYERLNDIQAIAGDETIEEYFATLNDKKKDLEIEDDLTRRLSELSVVTGPWDNIELVNTKGNTIFGLEEETHTGTESEVQQKLVAEGQLGKSGYSDAFLSEETKTPTMIFAVPVHDDRDEARPVVGVAIAHLSWPVISDTLRSSEPILVNLYNNKGIEIANNDDDSSAGIFVKDSSEIPSLKKALSGNAVSEVTTSVDSKEETLTSAVTEKGYLSYKGNGWVLLTEVPTKVAFAAAIASAIRITLILAPIVLAANALILLFILRVLHPIEKLTEATRKIADGDLDKRIEIRSSDEIGQLSQSFNEMADKLKEVYQGLEDRVKEKTAELALKVDEAERMNKIMVNRELKMIELKKELERLKVGSTK
ncbi:MAG: HAMP domain-containing protein [bacterium]|nr:HAMP domain-containing protein [bacterium]